MKVSNDGGFAGAVWQECVSPLPWTITQYGTARIPRVVYIKFRDGAGIISSTYSDDIILDVTAPTGTVQLQPLVQRQPCAPADCPHTVLLSLSATDDASGVGSMQIGDEPAFLNRPWQAYAASLAWYLPAGRTTVYVRFRDNAGNVSSVVSAALRP